MTAITQKQLIEQIKMLKEIKPRKEWAVLLKSQILSTQKELPIQAKSVGFMSIVSSVFTPKKLVYAFASVLFLVVGVFSFSTYENLPQKQTASLSGADQQAVIIRNQISAAAKNLSQTLKNNPTQDSQAMKILVKTLADIPGDVAASLDMKDLMKTVVQSQLTDLQKTTLTDDQKVALTEAQNLYDQGKYTDALEKLLLINK